jgi:predicted DNA-binding protein with PD1-like motif
MKYAEGGIGRVFLLKFEHGDDLLEELKRFAKEKKIKSGLVHMVGALERAEIVVGPKRKTMPPEAVWKRFRDCREFLGTGTIFWSGSEPGVHLHGAIGRGGKVNVGCVRKGTKAYIVIEAVVLELKGAGARRSMDPASGMALLEIGGSGKKQRRKGKHALR